MSFVSYSFAAFFAIALLLRGTVGRSKTHTAYLLCLLCGSLLFYAWYIPAYLLIITATTLIDYASGRLLGRSGLRRPQRIAILAVSIAAGLGMLILFKYAGFFAEAIASLLAPVGFSPHLPTLGLALPIGISFYTFQSMSYTIDVYRGHLEPIRSFWRFFLYVSFFPQLMAGPIVRAKQFIRQIDRRRSVNCRVMAEGAYLMIKGFFFKMVVADNLGAIVDSHWNDQALGHNSFVALLVTVCFAGQIYADFSGYSSIARGAALAMGFHLPVNFRTPYIAATFREFWRRWHITLSEWLRDYLYIPLGGNRRSRLRTFANLALVMLLGGLWHGAALKFIAWGAIHGVALISERILYPALIANRPRPVRRLLWALYVQITVLVAWIVFRSDSLAQSWEVISRIAAGRMGAVGVFPLFTALALLAPICVEHSRALLHDRQSMPTPGLYEKAFLAAMMLYATLTCYGTTHAFIYFQF